MADRARADFESALRQASDLAVELGGADDARHAS
jgi:hypothetical protein